MPELPLFPVTVVGSWPRPPWLLQALRQRQAGQLSRQAFDGMADAAVLEALRYQEEAGVDIVSDGEQRRDNFYSFVVDKLEGVRLMTLAEMLDLVEDKAYFDQLLRQFDAPAYAIKNPTVVDKVRPRMPLALDDFEFLRQHTQKPIKVTLPGPYLLTRSMWVQGVSDGLYATRESLATDIVAVLREEVLRLREAGAAFVQLDEPVLSEVAFRPPTKVRTFMCAAIAASGEDPQAELLWATRLVNAVVSGIDGIRLGLHVCRGNWSRKEEVLLTGGYEPLLNYLVAMRVQQWVLEFATPRAGEVDVFQVSSGLREIGLGVVNPRSLEVEDVNAIASRVQEALRYFKPSQIFLNPDCGFGTFAERPITTAETAARKLSVLVKAARLLRQRY